MVFSLIVFVVVPATAIVNIPFSVLAKLHPLSRTDLTSSQAENCSGGECVIGDNSRCGTT